MDVRGCIMVGNVFPVWCFGGITILQYNGSNFPNAHASVNLCGTATSPYYQPLENRWESSSTLILAASLSVPNQISLVVPPAWGVCLYEECIVWARCLYRAKKRELPSLPSPYAPPQPRQLSQLFPRSRRGFLAISTLNHSWAHQTFTVKHMLYIHTINSCVWFSPGLVYWSIPKLNIVLPPVLTVENSIALTLVHVFTSRTGTIASLPSACYHIWVSGKASSTWLCVNLPEPLTSVSLIITTTVRFDVEIVVSPRSSVRSTSAQVTHEVQ
jgi:hypothetical protein